MLRIVAVALALAGWTLSASDYDEFAVKRKEVFAFERKPELARSGEQITIRFESKDYCDVTVAVEDTGGRAPRIVRHLACGVLGPKAPPPLLPNSLKQTLSWDGKDDRGRYIDNLATCRIRVSLGLRARLERFLHWEPRKHLSVTRPPIPHATPKGVLLYDGEVIDLVRLFDHDGVYKQTVYPFAAGKLESIKDLQWRKFPQDGQTLPLREGHHQATLLNSGTNRGFKDYGIPEFPEYEAHVSANAASALAGTKSGAVAVARLDLNRLHLDGSTGGLPLKGGRTAVKQVYGGGRAYKPEAPDDVPPASMVFSPDGGWLYLAGYRWDKWRGNPFFSSWFWMHGITRLKFKDGAKAELWLGSADEKGFGDKPGQFKCATSVDADDKGRVYVSDYHNHRIQIFAPDGTYLKSIQTKFPAQVCVDRTSGEIWALSWILPTPFLKQKQDEVAPHATRFGAFDDPRKLASYPLPFPRKDDQGTYDEQRNMVVSGRTSIEVHAALDGWADKPTLWIAGRFKMGRYEQVVKTFLLQEKDGKLEEVLDFHAETQKHVKRDKGVYYSRQRLYVRPKTGALFVGEGDSGQPRKSFRELLEIDPESGAVKVHALPYDAEDLAFDPDGLAILRARKVITRHDPVTWHEVPWDYGVESDSVSHTQHAGMGKIGAAISGLPIPGWRNDHHGGMSVSLKGHLAVCTHVAGELDEDVEKREGEEQKAQDDPEKLFGKVIPLYKGRTTAGLVTVWDHRGKVIHKDAVPGMAFSHGLHVDKDDNLYAMMVAVRVLDGRPYHNQATDTLVKFRPNAARILATGKSVPLPLEENELPKRPPDLLSNGASHLKQGWIENAEWFYGGVGYNGRNRGTIGAGCDCWNARFDLDYFARSFAPEVDHYSVAVLDSHGNLILRVGRYGNADDGKPLAESGTGKPRSLGGDEVGLFYAPYVATQTDKRLFIADPGNQRILSVKLDYHEEATASLKEFAPISAE